MEGGSGVTRSVIEEFRSSDIQRDQMEGESGATQSNIDELHSSDIQGDQLRVKVVVLEDSLMEFILRISKEIN